MATAINEECCSRLAFVSFAAHTSATATPQYRVGNSSKLSATVTYVPILPLRHVIMHNVQCRIERNINLLAYGKKLLRLEILTRGLPGGTEGKRK
jgi:hypothetical protein